MSEDEEKDIKKISRRAKRPRRTIPSLREKGPEKTALDAAGERSGWTVRKAIHNHFWTFVAYNAPGILSSAPENAWADIDDDLIDWKSLMASGAWDRYWEVLKTQFSFVSDDKMAKEIKSFQESAEIREIDEAVSRLSEFIWEEFAAKDRLEDELEYMAETDPEHHKKVVAELKEKGLEISEEAEATRRERYAVRQPLTRAAIDEATKGIAKTVLDQMGILSTKWDTAFKELKSDQAKATKKQAELFEELSMATALQPPGAPGARVDIDMERITDVISQAVGDAIGGASIDLSVPTREVNLQPYPCPIHLAESVNELAESLERFPTPDEIENIITEMLSSGKGIVYRDKNLEKALRAMKISYQKNLAVSPFPVTIKWYEMCEDHRVEMYPTSFPPLDRLDMLVGKIVFDGVMTVQDFIEYGIPKDWVEGARGEYGRYRAAISAEDRQFLDQADPFSR